MRRLFLLGLCFALALQGAVQASVVEKPCLMQKPGQVQSVHGAKTAHLKTAHNCCNDAHTSAKTGKACKTGQACALAGAWLMSPQDSSSFPSSTVSLVSCPQPFA